MFTPNKSGISADHFAFNLEPRIRAEAIGKFKSLTKSCRMALAADHHHTCKNFRLPFVVAAIRTPVLFSFFT